MDHDQIVKTVRDHIEGSGFGLGPNEVTISPYLCNSYSTTLRFNGENGVYTYAKIYTDEQAPWIDMDNISAISWYFQQRAVERCVKIDETLDLPDAAFKHTTIVEKVLYEIGQARPDLDITSKSTAVPRQSHVNAKLGPLTVEDGKLSLLVNLPETAMAGIEDKCVRLGDLIDLPECPPDLREAFRRTLCYFQSNGNSLETHLIGLRHVLDHRGDPEGFRHARYTIYEVIGKGPNGELLLGEPKPGGRLIDSKAGPLYLRRLVRTALIFSSNADTTSMGPGRWLESFALPIRDPGTFELALVVDPREINDGSFSARIQATMRMMNGRRTPVRTMPSI